MDHITTREQAADYFHMGRYSNRIPDRVMVVAPLYDSSMVLAHLTDVEWGVNPVFGNVGLGIGKYHDEPVAVMSCGIGSWVAGWSWGSAQKLDFKKAIFLGAAAAVGDDIGLEEYVLSDEASRSIYTEIMCPDNVLLEAAERVVVAKPDANVSSALRNGFKSKTATLHEGRTFSTDANYGQERKMLEELRLRKYMALDREHAPILIGSKRMGIDAGAVLYITDRIGKDIPGGRKFFDISRKCSTTGIPVVLDALVANTE